MMSWDFRNAEELLHICSENNMPISEVMILREMELGGLRREEIIEKIDDSLRVMNVSVERAISDPVGSMGGLLGGEAQKLSRLNEDKAVCRSAVYMRDVQ